MICEDSMDGFTGTRREWAVGGGGIDFRGDGRYVWVDDGGSWDDESFPDEETAWREYRRLLDVYRKPTWHDVDWVVRIEEVEREWEDGEDMGARGDIIESRTFVYVGGRHVELAGECWTQEEFDRLIAQ